MTEKIITKRFYKYLASRLIFQIYLFRLHTEVYFITKT